MRDIATFQAMNRFGLGATPSTVDAVGRDPKGWVLGQIGPYEIPVSLAGFGSAEEIMREIHAARCESVEAARRVTRQALRSTYASEVTTRAQEMVTSPRPFAERMVLFWSNHFTVSNGKAIIAPAIPAYEREAIRPYVFGRFRDMLKAVVRHPVMLSYLDNVASIDERSRVGTRRRSRTGVETTLNENLAREVLELHTLGVNGGYSQKDVIEFAKAISGWSHGGIGRRRGGEDLHGRFQFRAEFHEPGAKTILGRHYRKDGPNQGLTVLDDLARHPATATFIATKLVRHFVADDPPAPSIARVADVFRRTDGDLEAVSRAIVELDTAWRDPLTKVKSHYEYLLAVYRATGRQRFNPGMVMRPLSELGQAPFSAPSPQGWGDIAADWIAPEALMRRVEWVRRFASTQRVAEPPDVILDNLIGPVATSTTRREVRRAPSGDAALALILASPEFQRR